ncbi:MAG: hypothetical protein Q4B70_10735 [Lachnospiraceae bacterium]|nr:hypothetical protein [Lachnospiraceae bacterium]
MTLYDGTRIGIFLFICVFAQNTASLMICYMVMRTMLHPKKWSILPFFLSIMHNVYTFVILFVDIPLLHNGSFFHVNVFIEIVYSVCQYLLFIHFFEDNAMKTILASFMGEFLAVFLLGINISILSGFKENGWETMYPYKMGIRWLFLIPLMAITFFIIHLCIHRILEKFRDIQLKHTKIWALLLAFFIVYAVIVSRLTSENIQWFLSGGYFAVNIACMALILFVATWIFVEQGHRMKQEREYLMQMNEMLKEEYETLKKQISYINAERENTENIMLDLEHKNSAVDSGRAKAYLAYLKEEHKKLSAGMYCDDYVLDAILTYAKRRCRQEAVDVHFAAQKFSSENHTEVSQEQIYSIVLNLIELGLWENSHAGTNRNYLSLKIASVKNYTIIQMLCLATNKDRNMIRNLQKTVEKENGTFQQKKKGEQKEITIFFP